MRHSRVGPAYRKFMRASGSSRFRPRLLLCALLFACFTGGLAPGAMASGMVELEMCGWGNWVLKGTCGGGEYIHKKSSGTSGTATGSGGSSAPALTTPGVTSGTPTEPTSGSSSGSSSGSGSASGSSGGASGASAGTSSGSSSGSPSTGGTSIASGSSSEPVYSHDNHHAQKQAERAAHQRRMLEESKRSRS